jgi:hypothetical protein
MLRLTVSVQMFEGFTDRARRVVVLAQEEARMLGHHYIGTEHIVLGLVHEGDGVAAKALESLGIRLEAVRQQVEEIVGQGQQPPSGHVPFTVRAKKALELSRQVSAELGRDDIGTGHILLGFLRVGESVGAQILVNLGADLDGVRQRVIQLLDGYQGNEPARAAEPSQFRSRAGSHDFLVSERSQGDALTAIGERLTGIERRLGISGQSPPGHYDEQIAKLRRAKEAAIGSGDLEQAAALRDQEKRLIERQEASAREQEPSGPGIVSVLEEAARLRAEVARLHALLRRHGIDPGSDQDNPAPVD